MLAAARPGAEAKGLVFEEHYANGVTQVRTDPVRLEQILLNLFSNAVRHSPEGATIAVHVASGTEGVTFRVADHGRGSRQRCTHGFSSRSNAFDPDSGVGTGLGLPVSRKLAELLGGRLTMESRVGEGATFTLLLPATLPEV